MMELFSLLAPDSRRIEKPRIVLLDCPLEYKKGESQVRVPVSVSVSSTSESTSTSTYE